MYVIIIVNLIVHTNGRVVGSPDSRVLCNFIDGVIWRFCQMRVRTIRQRNVRKVLPNY